MEPIQVDTARGRYLVLREAYASGYVVQLWAHDARGVPVLQSQHFWSTINSALAYVVLIARDSAALSWWTGEARADSAAAPRGVAPLSTVLQRSVYDALEAGTVSGLNVREVRGPDNQPVLDVAGTVRLSDLLTLGRDLAAMAREYHRETRNAI